jgi:hypothetical protein
VGGHFLRLLERAAVGEIGGAPDRQVALISNPLTRVWSDRFASELDVPFEWLGTPDYDYKDMQRSRQRLGAIMELHFEMGRNDEFKRIIEDVLKRHGLKEGDVIPKESPHSIPQDIATRITHSVFNKPYMRPITSAQMQDVFGKKLPNEEH